VNKEEIERALKEHRKWLNGEGGSRADLRRADLCGADLYGADLRGASLCGAYLRGTSLREADLRGADLCGADLYGADLQFCKGILSFTGEKNLLIYFKWQDEYYFKIGRITRTCNEWLKEFEDIGVKHKYGENTKLYGDVIKLFSQYDLEEKENMG